MSNNANIHSNGYANRVILDLLDKARDFVMRDTSLGDSELDAHVKARVLQILSFNLADDVPKMLRSNPERMAAMLEGEGRLVLSGGLYIDAGKQRLGIIFGRGLGRGILRYAARWVLAFLAILKGFFWAEKLAGARFSLVYGLADTGPADAIYMRDHNYSRFELYLNQNPIPPLRESTHTISQLSRHAPASLQRQKSLARFPEIEFLSAVPLPISQRISLLFRHVLGVFQGIMLVLKMPLARVVCEDLAMYFCYRYLEEIEATPKVILTSSNLRAQPLWMRQLGEGKLHCLHYATMPVTPIHKDDPYFFEAGIVPEYTQFTPMHHWVWFDSDAKILRALYNQEKTEAFGVPLLFAGDRVTLPPLQDTVLDIVIFDVIPYYYDAEQTNKNFYFGAYKTARAVVEDTLDMAEKIGTEEGLEVRVTLKPKRATSSKHDQRYIQFLKDLEAAENAFSCLSPALAIGEVLTSKTLVIARPFTSAGFIAASLGARTLFYDPHAELINNLPATKNITMIQGKAALKAAIIDHCDHLKHWPEC